MKNLNKVLALVIVLAMAFSTVAFASFSDVTEDASYAEAVEVMSALGLLAGYEDGSFGPDKTITRAEFSAVIVRALGMEESAKGVYGATNFSDVAADAWYAGYVMIASQQGIVNGYPDGTFKPENPVKFEEAVKMIMCMLNYQKKFEKVENPYPTAYIAEAHTTGITLGANLAIGQEASRAIVARLVYNSLTVGKMRQVAFGTEDQWSVPANAYTLLSENLAVARVEGYIGSVKFDGTQKLTYVISNIAPQFSSDRSVRDDYYYPNPEIAKAGDQVTWKYADNVDLIKHYSTIAYVDVTDSANPVVLCVVEKPGVNSTLTLTGTQLKDGALTQNNLSYFKTSSDVDSKATQVRMADDFLTFVNMNSIGVDCFDGQGQDQSNGIVTNLTAGAYPVVTLIDNNNNNAGYEVVVATAYYSAVVEDVNTNINKITFDTAYGSGRSAANMIFLNPADETYSFAIYDENGAEITIEDIKKGDVLSVVESYDSDSATTFKEVYVTATKVEGTITEKSDKANYYVVDGEEYYSFIDLVVGDTGVFYVDMFDKVLDFELSEDSNRNFGILYALYPDNNDPLNQGEPKAVIMDANGQFATYAFAKNVRINAPQADDPNTQNVDESKLENVTVTNDDIKGDVANYSRSVVPATQQIVMYTVNGSGVLSELYWGYGINRRDDRYDITSVMNVNARAQYKENTARLGSVVIPEEMTFATLEGTTWQDMDPTNNELKQSEFATTSTAVLDEDNDEGYLYSIVYNKENKNAVYGILFDCKAKTAGSSPVMLVTAVGDTTDADGAAAKKVTGWVDGVKVSFVVSDDVYYYNRNNDLVVNSQNGNEVATAAATVDKGALIQYVGTDVASAIRILVTPAEMLATATNNNGLSGQLISDNNGTTTEMNDKIGALYVGQLAEYRGGSADFVGGANLSVPTVTPTTLIRLATATVNQQQTTILGNIYGGETMAFGVAESTKNTYDANQVNDDFVIVYSFDGEAQAAVILDAANDDIWN